MEHLFLTGDVAMHLWRSSPGIFPMGDTVLECGIGEVYLEPNNEGSAQRRFLYASIVVDIYMENRAMTWTSGRLHHLDWIKLNCDVRGGLGVAYANVVMGTTRERVIVIHTSDWTSPKLGRRSGYRCPKRNFHVGLQCAAKRALPTCVYGSIHQLPVREECFLGATLGGPRVGWPVGAVVHPWWCRKFWVMRSSLLGLGFLVCIPAGRLLTEKRGRKRGLKIVRERGAHPRGDCETENVVNTNTFLVLGENSRSTNVNDLSNPYYVSNGDNSGVVLVPKILTGSEKYNTWRRPMLIALVARNKVKFVYGRLPQPDDDHEDYDSWCRYNNTVISWILHAISDEITNSIMYLDNAAEIWSELHESFNERNAPQIFEANKTMQSNPRQFTGAVQPFKSKFNCTHCGMNGHTIERCYRLIGYPPGHKLYGKFPNRNAAPKSAATNAMGTDEEKLEDAPGDKDLVSSLTNVQCQKLMTLLAQKVANNSSINTPDEQPIVSHFSDKNSFVHSENGS
uniref:Retrotransposon Copia-like N-terminal domain-containing protein n=1 Tax=Cannabis sativa TaxID=3483 RepID=A0A803P836_CANSA